MEFKDHYATLGVERGASPDEIKKSYRKLARKYHPDVSKEKNAETRFKEVTEAYEVLGDAERRAAYDEAGQRRTHARDFRAPPGWSGEYEFGGNGAGGQPGMEPGDLFESLFGRRNRAAAMQPGADQQTRLTISLLDAYRGASRTIALRVPVTDAQGRTSLQDRQLDVVIPKGVRAGQKLRLSRQGGPGRGGGQSGDLYLEIAFEAHPHFRVEGKDVFVDLPLAPWEAALGATVAAPTPEGSVELSIPAGSAAGRKLRLKGRGLPGEPPGDLYAVLGISTPPADSDATREAYAALARSAPAFNPRSALGN